MLPWPSFKKRCKPTRPQNLKKETLSTPEFLPRTRRSKTAQALVAATLNSAHAVGLGDKVGSLQTGRKADVVILDLPDVQHLGYRFGTNPVAVVVKNGQVVSQ